MNESIKYFTVKQVAERFGVAIASVYAWVDKGLIGFHKLGGSYRFSEEDVRIFEKRNHFPIPRERAF